VNVTAGMDLSIGEFQEVGNIVKQFASDDATVVVGTVIDPELSDEMRVTVVATGLGKPEVAVSGRSPFGREVPTLSKAAPQAAAQPAEPAMRVVPRRPLTAADYAALDKPAVQRQRAVGDGLQGIAEPEDVLDIPAFLRRQAD
jgi:cell division protein FtsZ